MTELDFACIGSRGTPASHLEVMRQIGGLIARDGNRVVSGNCKGADQAYQLGANEVDPKLVRIYLPWHSYERDAIQQGNEVSVTDTNEAIKLAESHHPAYQYLKPAVKKLMNRNGSIVLGSKYMFAYLNHSVKGSGGTGHGWSIADSLGIPRLDLSEVDLTGKDLERVAETLYEEALERIKQRDS